jgi:hypothetical protein
MGSGGGERVEARRRAPTNGDAPRGALGASGRRSGDRRAEAPTLTGKDRAARRPSISVDGATQLACHQRRAGSRGNQRGRPIPPHAARSSIVARALAPESVGRE